MKGRVLGAINACVVVIALSVNATNANASVFNFTFTGVFTVQDSAGDFLLNTDATGNSWAGYRTDVAGTYSLDDVTGSGFVTVTPFDFLGGGPVQFTSGATQYIGDGFGNPGTLTLGNFTFDWSGNTGINMDLVWDTSGLLDALSMNMSPGDIISGNQVIIAGNAFPIVSALPASDSVTVGPTSFPIGPTPMATTAFDLAGGTLPLIADPSGIGGSPMAGPYLGDSMSLDIGDFGSMQLVSITPSAVPVPAAVWLFGSGLFGLVGIARRSNAT